MLVLSPLCTHAALFDIRTALGDLVVGRGKFGALQGKIAPLGHYRTWRRNIRVGCGFHAQPACQRLGHG